LKMFLKMYSNLSEAQRDLLRLRDAEVGESFVETDVRSWHDSRSRLHRGARYIVPLQTASVERLRVLCLGWRRSGGFGFGYELRESRSVLHCDIREDFAVQRNAGNF